MTLLDLIAGLKTLMLLAMMLAALLIAISFVIGLTVFLVNLIWAAVAAMRHMERPAPEDGKGLPTSPLQLFIDRLWWI